MSLNNPLPLAALAEHFTEAAVEFTKALKQGNGLEAGIEVGPMFEGKALEQTSRLVNDATGKGARLLTGGKRSSSFDKGYFFEPTVLVANLPYNVSVPVFLHLLEILPTLRSGVVMVQAEVADRLAAKPNTKEYGIPSVKAAWWADVTGAGSVSRSIFWPAPNVDSKLVGFKRRATPGDETLRKEVFTIIDLAFAQRRKMLRAALSSRYGGSAAAEAHLIAAGIDPTLRGESLDIHGFCKIAQQGLES